MESCPVLAEKAGDLKLAQLMSELLHHLLMKLRLDLQGVSQISELESVPMSWLLVAKVLSLKFSCGDWPGQQLQFSGV